jgi:ABC-type Fe3+ transport system permease subunit
MTEEIEAQETDILEEDSELVPADRRSSLVSTLRGVPYIITSWFSRRARSVISWFGRILRRLRGFFRDPKTSTRDWASRARARVVAGARRTRRELDAITSIQLIAVVGVFTLFLILPLLSVAVFAFTSASGEFTLDHFIGIFGNRRIWPFVINPSGGLDVFLNFNAGAYSPELNAVAIWGWDFGAIINSIYMALIVTGAAVVLGVFFAFIMAKYDFFGKSVIRTVLIFPILAIPFIGAIGIKEFLSLDGFINKLFYETLHIFPSAIVLQGIAAMIFVQSFSLFSLVYLNAYSSFMSIDPSLEEQAENLGATGFKLFRSVTLPLAMPGIQAGAILTFILSIEDLGSPIVFQDHPTARNTLSFKIFEAVAGTQAGVEGAVGPAIGIVLLVFALVGFLAIRKYTALRSYDAGTKGGQWNPRTRRISRRIQVLLYCLLVPVLFLALIPQISVVMIALAGSWQPQNLLPDTWTLSNFDVLWAFPDVAQSINITLFYGAVATVIIVLLGSSAAYIIARKDIPGKSALDLLVTAPIALPGIVIATGYFTFFYNTPIFPIGHPAFLIMMSYTVRKFPFTVRAAYAGLMSTPVVLEEASQNMGASKNRTFLKITLPLIGVSVLAGSLLSFVYSVSEVSTSLLLGSVGHSEAPLTYWTSRVLAMIGQWGGPTSAACLGVLLMAMQWIVITLANKILGARSAAITGI